MPIYRYKVLTKDGLKKDGSILADDYKRAYEALRVKRYRPLEIKRAYFISRQISLEDLSAFFTHLNFQLKCGVRINEAIESFADFRGNLILNATLLDISNSLKNGEGVGKSFEKCGFIFDDVIVGLLKATESAGNTVEIISNILNFLKLQTDWKNNVKRAIAYPIFITLVALTVLIFSLGILGPQVASLMESCEEIPVITRFMIDAAPKISQIAGAFLALLLAILSFFLTTQRGISRVALKTPKIGSLIVKISAWQFCKILSVALDAKLDFLKSLDLAIEAVKLAPLKDELKNIRGDIADGYKIASSFLNGNLMPREIVTAIYVGEEGNDLSGALNCAAENQYKEILLDVKALGQVLSVGLTLFTGLIFILILCGLFYPIYNYVEISNL